MTLKLAQFCDDPQKISTKSSYPQKILIFLKTPKNIEIQNFEPKKNAPSLRMCENIRVPPPPPPPGTVPSSDEIGPYIRTLTPYCAYSIRLRI